MIFNILKYILGTGLHGYVVIYIFEFILLLLIHEHNICHCPSSLISNSRDVPSTVT